jgi:cytochrome c-type biogenesis protein CcmH
MSWPLLFSALGALGLGLGAWWLLRPLARAGQRGLALGLAGVLLAGSGALYLVLGVPAALEPAARTPAGSIDLMVAKLAARLAEQPDDAAGWLMLGRSYAALGRYAEAQQAYLRVRDLSGDQDAAALAGYAEARVLEDPSRLTGEGATLFARVRELAPDDVKGLWYGALAAAEQGDAPTADAMLARLLTLQPPPELQQAIERQRAALGVSAADPAAFRVTVELAPDLVPGAGDALFVYLRRPGQPMPIAARRVALAGFPAELSIGPQDALQGQPIPDDEPLIVGARLAATAGRQSGQPFGEFEVVAGRRVATVRIDRRVP